MSKKVKVSIRPDSGGEYKIHYECEGFEGTECEGIAEIMQHLGTVEKKTTTDDAHAYKIPVPVPNKTGQ